MSQPTTPDETLAARHAFTLLLEGNPNGATPEQLGAWWSTYDAIKTVHDREGNKAAVRAFDVAQRANRNLTKLMALGSRQTTKARHGMPPLPADVQAIERHAAPCGQWVDEYVSFASKAAPMTPRSFHEAAALSLCSAVIARRLCYTSGLGQTFTNLFILQIADAAVYKKTTGLNIAAHILSAAGLDALLIPQTITPQSLINEMSTEYDPKIEGFSEELRALWMQERAFAAQRAWRIDEAAQLFDSFEREFNAGLHQMILELYDCKDSIQAQTNTRGRTIVRRAYLSILGATTPESIRKHLTSKTLWGSGLWSRFCLVTPDSPPVYAPRPEKEYLPMNLVSGLKGLYELFPVPRATVEDREYDESEKGLHKKGAVTKEYDHKKGENKKTVRELVVWNQTEPIEATMADGVNQAINAYGKAVGFDMAFHRLIDPLFYSAYDRLSSHLIKVSLILAALDAQQKGRVVVEMRHVARALRIVEGWRASLHQVYGQIAATDESQLTDRILELLTKEKSMTVREIGQRTHKLSNEIKAALMLLAESGQVDQTQMGRRQVWHMNESVASVAKRSNDTDNTSSPSESLKTQSVAV